MKYLLEGTGKTILGQEDYDNIEIPVVIDQDGDNVTVIFSGPDWWIPYEELKQMISIIETHYK